MTTQERFNSKREQILTLTVKHKKATVEILYLCEYNYFLALSEIEEKYKGIGTVSLYFQVVQWFLRVGLLPERCDAYVALPYPADNLYTVYNKR